VGDVDSYSTIIGLQRLSYLLVKYSVKEAFGAIPWHAFRWI